MGRGGYYGPALIARGRVCVVVAVICAMPCMQRLVNVAYKLGSWHHRVIMSIQLIRVAEQ